MNGLEIRPRVTYNMKFSFVDTNRRVYSLHQTQGYFCGLMVQRYLKQQLYRPLTKFINVSTSKYCVSYIKVVNVNFQERNLYVNCQLRCVLCPNQSHCISKINKYIYNLIFIFRYFIAIVC